VGENTAKAIRDSRLSAGEFTSLYDLCERIEAKFLNKRVFESLIKCGALDSLGPRESMLASVDDALAAVQRATRIRESGQHGLFGGTAAAPATIAFELHQAEPWSEAERLASEYAMLGFYVSGHPLAKYASRLQELKCVSLDQIEGQRNGKEITVAVLIVGTRPMRSKKGARWAIYTIQDMTGVQELLAFPESFAKHELTLKAGTPLLLKARVQVEEAGTRLSLQEVARLGDLAERPAAGLRIRMKLDELNDESLDRLDEILASYRGSSPVTIDLADASGATATLQLEQRARSCPELIAAIRGSFGEQSIGLVM
jgi:DNA polymerase-3 subunit alpha